MDFIPPLSCPKDAPLQFTHNLDNHLQLSLMMDTYQSAEETPRCLHHKSPSPHSGRPLARLCHERIDSHPHRTTTPDDNSSQITSKCLRTHLPCATRHSSHRHSGLHPTFNMTPPKRMSTTPLGRPNRQRHPDVSKRCRDSNAR